MMTERQWQALPLRERIGRLHEETKDAVENHRSEYWRDASLTSEEAERKAAYEARFFSIVAAVGRRLVDEDPFYGYFLFQMGQTLAWHLTDATGVTFKDTRYVLRFNPFLFLTLTPEQMMTALRHEILHVVALHPLRIRRLREQYSPLAINLAMDLVVNGYLTELPDEAVTVKGVNAAYGLELLPFKSLEYYIEHIEEAIDIARETDGSAEVGDIWSDRDAHEVATSFDAAHTHDEWEEIPVESDLMQQFTEKAAKAAQKGGTPGYVEPMLKLLAEQKEGLPWQLYLKRMLGRVVSGYKKTNTRRHRRQPERLDLRGQLRKHRARIVVALDCSGSISDAAFTEALREVLRLVKSYDYEITIVECDDQIRRTYTVQRPEDVQSRLAARGGTAFSPVIAYGNEHQIDVLIYFTDGKGEPRLTVDPKGYPILWILADSGQQLSLKRPWGAVKAMRTRPFEIVEGEMEYERTDGYSMNNQEGFSMMNQEKDWED